MEGMYPALIFVIGAILAVWWFLRQRDAIALKRVVTDIKNHQTAEADRVIVAVRMVGRAPPRKPVRRKSARVSEDRQSDYLRDSEG